MQTRHATEEEEKQKAADTLLQMQQQHALEQRKQNAAKILVEMHKTHNRKKEHRNRDMGVATKNGKTKDGNGGMGVACNILSVLHARISALEAIAPRQFLLHVNS